MSQPHPPASGRQAGPELLGVAGPRRIVVLGSSGFLGGAMVHAAANAGHHVVAASRARDGGFPQDNVESARVDLHDRQSLANVFRPGDVVYHFAAATDTRLNLNDPGAEYEQSVAPLLSVIETATDAGIAKLVYPSSGGSLYADSPDLRHEDSALDPMTPYAIFKLASEHLLRSAARAQAFAVDIYRVANPYGPGQKRKPGQGVLPHWMDAIRRGHPLTVYGDGSMARDYLYIDDATALMLTSIDRIAQSDCLNLGSGRATSLNDLIAALRAATGADLVVEHQPARPNEVARVGLSMERFEQRVGKISFTSLEDGLRRTWQLG